jgi:maltose alpha-D-glucosyltransferase/alpha-amylase
MRYDWRNNSVLFVHNLDSKPKEVSFSAGMPDDTGNLLVNLLGDEHSRAGKDGKHHLLLDAYAYRWYRVGGLDYLLKRSEIEDSEEERYQADQEKRAAKSKRKPKGKGRNAK